MHHSDAHHSLLAYVEECAKTHGWRAIELYHPSDNYTYGKFVRSRLDWTPLNSQQSLKWVIKDSHIAMIKLASDGSYYDEHTTVNLAEPDSLDQIRAYFVH